jgi:hypothetical protein
VPAQLPLLLVDVDGVISLFGFDHTSPPGGFPVSVEGIPHWLSEGAGARLERLARTFECVWCTGWEERANEYLPALLDLPSGWPHVPLGTPTAAPHWKLAGIDAYAGRERPLAWIDDNHGPAVEEWALLRPGPTLLVGTEPHIGMTAAHASALREWAAALSGA